MAKCCFRLLCEVESRPRISDLNTATASVQSDILVQWYSGTDTGCRHALQEFFSSVILFLCQYRSILWLNIYRRNNTETAKWKFYHVMKKGTTVNTYLASTRCLNLLLPVQQMSTQIITSRSACTVEQVLLCNCSIQWWLVFSVMVASRGRNL